MWHVTDARVMDNIRYWSSPARCIEDQAGELTCSLIKGLHFWDGTNPIFLIKTRTGYACKCPQGTCRGCGPSLPSWRDFDTDHGIHTPNI